MKRPIAILLAIVLFAAIAIPLVIRDRRIKAEAEAAAEAFALAQASMVQWTERSEALSDTLANWQIAQQTQYEEDLAAKRAARLIAPISVDLSYWKQQNSLICGYIYGPGSPISYPIIHGSDNYFYLDHDIYGNSDINGCIMMEYMNRSDFTDNNTILYGHHMKSGAMFATLDRYKNSSYYADHPSMFLYTANQNYRLDLIAGFSCAHDDKVFRLDFTLDQIRSYMARSTFSTNVTDLSGPYVTLCTCSYEHTNWRYVVICKMVPIE